MIKAKNDEHLLAGHGHEHDHHEHSGHTEVILYFIGLAGFLFALFLSNALLKNVLFLLTFLLSGYHIIIEGFIDTVKHSLRLKKFYPNVHLLMTFAAVGAILIGEFMEAALLILIFAGAHYLEDYAQSKSTKEIASLLEMHPKNARKLHPDGQIEIVDVTEVKIGDQLLVLNGDQIPADGIVLSGRSTVDESAITGESIPVEKNAGDIVYASTINGDGTLTMEVTKDSSDSVFAKIIELVQQTKTNISKTAITIQHFMPLYVTAVLLIAPLFFIIGYFGLKWTFDVSFYRTMVFLIAASPCALAVTDIPATLSALSNLAKRGVLFKGGASLANLADLKAVAFDKTGTLTEGAPSVSDVHFDEQLPEEQKQFYRSIIASMERKANHPLAEAILRHFGDAAIFDMEVDNEIGRGLSGKFQQKTYKIGKPSIVGEVSSQLQEVTNRLENEGKTVVYFCEEDKVICVIGIQDAPKDSAKKAIQYFKTENIYTVMLSGDAERTAKAIGEQLGIDEVRGNVLPEEKAVKIRELKNDYPVIAMFGDGVNDAPALATADIGIAMGKGTDIAIDVADGVLMKNDLGEIAYAHRLAKKLRKIVWQNIAIALSVVLFLIFINFFGFANMTFAVVVHEGSTLLVILNGLRLLRGLKD